jgi:putative DNA methylase
MREWCVRTRRRLPHWYVRGRAHFVTFRLACTVPRAVGDLWRERRARERELLLRAGADPADADQLLHKRLFGWYDRYLDDAEHPRRWLGDPRVASLVREALAHFDGERYRLLSYAIMPNHVHVLVQLAGFARPAAPYDGAAREFHPCGEAADQRSPLARVLHSWKSFTANAANQVLGRTGPFWHPESYDHWIRADRELLRVAAYIARNPVKAGLCAAAEDYPWTAAHELAARGRDPRGLLARYAN